MSLEDLVIYVCKKYPHSRELSKARLTKIIYLIDWKSCQNTGRQLTEIKWYFDNYGPYVEDVVEAAKKSLYLNVEQELNFYGKPKERVVLVDDSYIPNVGQNIEFIINEVFEETKKLYWDDFIKHVYSTAPIKSSQRYSYINLQKIAKISN